MSNSVSASGPCGRPVRPAGDHSRNARFSQRLAAAVFCALFWPEFPAIQSTTLARMDLQEMAMRATFIAHVRCVNAVSWAHERLVWTLTTFDVLQTWKGDPPAKFTVGLPGGEAAGWRVTVEGAPRFAVGEEAVLFLEPDGGLRMNIVGWAQGTFRIHRDPRTGAEEATQDTAGLRVVEARTGRSSEGGLRQLPLPLLRAMVARAIVESTR
jgi:hypothetical protein